MNEIYKRNCNTCGKYYEGRGKYYCSHKCLHVARKETIPKLLDGTWYPHIQITCQCSKIDCNEICWIGDYKRGHFPIRKGCKPWNYGLTKDIDNRIKRYSENMKGDLHPRKGIRITPIGWKQTEKQKEANKIRLEKQRLNPEKHPNRIMAKKGFISKPQKKLFELLKLIFFDADLEYPIRVKNKRLKFADIGVPSLKLCFEYDGTYWHKDNNKDIQRQKEIEEMGWKVIRFVGKEDMSLELIKLKLSKLNINL